MRRLRTCNTEMSTKGRTVTNVEISVSATGAPHDTGITVEQWRSMSVDQRQSVIDMEIFDSVDVQIHGVDDDDE